MTLLQNLREFLYFAKYSLLLTMAWGLFVIGFFPNCTYLVSGIYLLGGISLYKLALRQHTRNQLILKFWVVFMLLNISFASDILSSMIGASSRINDDISDLTKVLLIFWYPLLFACFTSLMRIVQRFC